MFFRGWDYLEHARQIAEAARERQRQWLSGIAWGKRKERVALQRTHGKKHIRDVAGFGRTVGRKSGLGRPVRRQLRAPHRGFFR